MFRFALMAVFVVACSEYAVVKGGAEDDGPPETDTANPDADGGSTDESTPDEGTPDEGTTDEGTPDEGTTDEGTPDEGTTDEGIPDEGTTDEGPPDEGPPDEGPPDEGPPDEGPPDEGPTDECPPLETDDSVEVIDSCIADPEAGPLGAWVEWEMDEFDDEYSTYDEMVTAPIIGQLTDDNGDGFIDEFDIPDIIATFDDNGIDEEKFGVIRRISGNGYYSEVLITPFEMDGDDWGPYRYGTSAIGDVDNDGYTDILVVLAGPPTAPDGPPPDGPPSDDPPAPEDHPISPPPPPTFPPDSMEPDISCHVGAFESDGTLKWVYNGSFVDCGGHAIGLADLEGDGTVEVILGKVIVNGEDGSLQGEGYKGDASYGGAYFEVGQIPAIGDLDGDGQQEVLAGNTIYDSDGNEICSLMEPSKDGFTAIADLDMDGDGEIVMVWNHIITIINEHCHEIAEWPMVGEGTGGPPTIADFDADGEPEIGVASALDYCVYEPTGALLWAFGTTDESSHATGSTVYDFEGDGRPEVVYGDEVKLWVLDGPTGAVRLEDDLHSSRTLHEYPVVVDVDGDGYPEIVVPNGGGHHDSRSTGLYVLGSTDPGGWLGGRQIWNQHAYNIVNINDDLTIPESPEPNWPYHNNFRSGDVNPVYGSNAPDAVPLVDACDYDCDEGILRLQVRLANQGTATLRTDMKLTVYDSESGAVLALETISPPLEPGEASEPFEYAFDEMLVGEDGLFIIVDDADGIEAVRECDEDNNGIELTDATCML